MLIHLAFIKQASVWQDLKSYDNSEKGTSSGDHKTMKDGPNQMASDFFISSQKMLVDRCASAELRAALDEFWSSGRYLRCSDILKKASPGDTSRQ